MGAAASNGKDNEDLVDILVDYEYLKTPSLQQVFRAVDRGDYYTMPHKSKAYRDAAWKCGNLHISAPCVYSEVMEALKLKAGLSFLNLGSGTGYLSTIAGLILGSYGINHGIEYFTDVVDYANLRLEEFMSKSQSIDAYEFCVPNFIVGNCLHIDYRSQLYDRVYCGAACPAEHETYMKHLIRIGGILVMPLNNKLLQITRTSETTWESTKVLSVSFAPLLYPSEKNVLTFVKLPDFSPPSLQETCRSFIRTMFRNQIDTEHPGLKEPKCCKSKANAEVSRIVIPLSNPSDSSTSSSSSDSDSEDILDIINPRKSVGTSTVNGESKVDKSVPKTLDTRNAASSVSTSKKRRSSESKGVSDKERAGTSSVPASKDRSDAAADSVTNKDAATDVAMTSDGDGITSHDAEKRKTAKDTAMNSGKSSRAEREPTRNSLRMEYDETDAVDRSPDVITKTFLTLCQAAMPPGLSVHFESTDEDELPPSTSANSTGREGRKRLLTRSPDYYITSKARRQNIVGKRIGVARRRTATFMWRSIHVGDTCTTQHRQDSDDEDEAEIKIKSPTKAVVKEEKPNDDTENYRVLMLQKICQLPLPVLLKRYLNYRRDTL